VKVQAKPIDSIRPYPGNPRLNDDAVDAVAESIRRFGFRQPIVVDAEGVVVAGHTRLKAARKLGLETVPVHVAADLSAEQVRAYRLADNASAEKVEWDHDQVRSCFPSSLRRWPPADSAPRASASIRMP
jgi:ParB family chromosome partitioning protein